MRQFRNIQVLRGIAANAVVLCHLVNLERKYSQGYDILPPWLGSGEYGVDLFFVISGFVMVYTSRTARWSDFLVARITRIYPAYWFYTTLLIPVFLFYPQVVNSGYSHPASLWRSYLLVPDTVSPLLGAAWTLIHEMYFYLAFALILGWRLPLKTALSVWAIMVAGISLAAHQEVAAIDMPAIKVIVHPLTLEFIFGAACGLLIQAHVFRGPLAFLGIAMAWIAWGFWGNTGGDWYRVLAFGIPFTVLLYSLLVLELRWGGLPFRLLSQIGDASYSTYLSNLMIMSLIGRIFAIQPIHGWLAEGLFVVSCVVLVNAFSMVSYSYIERPSLRWSRRFWYGVPKLSTGRQAPPTTSIDDVPAVNPRTLRK